jgi:prophage regulatory protein
MQHQKFLRLNAVVDITGLKRSTIYERAKKGMFPKPIKLGGSHASGWLAEEIAAWMQACVRLARTAEEAA